MLSVRIALTFGLIKPKSVHKTLLAYNTQDIIHHPRHTKTSFQISITVASQNAGPFGSQKQSDCIFVTRMHEKSWCLRVSNNSVSFATADVIALLFFSLHIKKNGGNSYSQFKPAHGIRHEFIESWKLADGSTHQRWSFALFHATKQGVHICSKVST